MLWLETAFPLLTVGRLATGTGATVLENRGQGGNERVPTLPQLVQAFADDALQSALAAREQKDANLPLIASAAGAADVAAGLQAIDQTDGAVMA